MTRLKFGIRRTFYLSFSLSLPLFLHQPLTSVPTLYPSRMSLTCAVSCCAYIDQNGSMAPPAASIGRAGPPGCPATNFGHVVHAVAARHPDVARLAVSGDVGALVEGEVGPARRRVRQERRGSSGRCCCASSHFVADSASFGRLRPFHSPFSRALPPSGTPPSPGRPPLPPRALPSWPEGTTRPWGRPKRNGKGRRSGGQRRRSRPRRRAPSPGRGGGRGLGRDEHDGEKKCEMSSSFFSSRFLLLLHFPPPPLQILPLLLVPQRARKDKEEMPL